MRLNLSIVNQGDNPNEIRVCVKVSADNKAHAALEDSHFFDLQECQKGLPIVADVFSSKPDPEILRRYGRVLSKALFPKNTPSRAWQLLQLELSGDRRVLLELNSDHDLDAIPWEYARISQEYLVYQCRFIRVCNPKEIQLSKLPLRILVVAPNPVVPPTDPVAKHFPDLHLSEQFHNFIDGHFSNNHAVILERVFPPTVDRMNLLLMSDPSTATVLHFMGHCGRKDKEKTLIFEDEDTGRHDFAATLRLVNEPEKLRLAFLCACDTRNVARALVENGVLYTIGSYCSIPDGLARKFESIFYQLLAGGCTIEKAMWKARMTLLHPDDVRQYDYFPGAIILYSSTFQEEDGAFEWKRGSPTIKNNLPHNNLTDISTSSTFHGCRKKLFKLISVLRGMANHGEQACRMYTIVADTSVKDREALTVEAMRRTAYLFPGGIFAWSFKNETMSVIKYLRRLVKVIFPDELQLKLKDQIDDDFHRLGPAIIKCFEGYPSCLLILDHAVTLKRAESSSNEDAIDLGKWLRQVASTPDINVKILSMSEERLGWEQEKVMPLDAVDMSDDATAETTPPTAFEHDLHGRRGEQISTFQSIPAKELVKYRFHGVPAENYAFVDRPKILENMNIALGGSSPSGGCRILALKGLGGMGKTQLMLRYCYLHLTEYEFIFWLEVDTWSAAVDSFRKLAINLGFDDKSIMGKDLEENIIDRVRSWLQANNKWLLLLNNADGTMADDVFRFLPRVGGDIILTTRESISCRMAKVIPIDKMQEEEATHLLLSHSANNSVDPESTEFRYAQKIVAELGCMPLAIDLARAYLENTITSFRNYLDKFNEKKERAALLEYSDKDNSCHYKHTVATVWKLSLERVRSQNPIAVQILEACTFLQPENIPMQLFQQQCFILELDSTSVSPTSEQNSKQSLAAVQEAIALLEKYSFVSLTRKEVEDDEDGEDSASILLTIHRLVQKVIYDSLSNERKLYWAHRMAAALNSKTAFLSSDLYILQTKRIVDVYISHIRYFVMRLDDLSQKPLISKDLGSMLIRITCYLWHHGTYLGIEELAMFSVQVSEAVYEPEHLNTMMPLSNLATVYEIQGKYNEAKTLYKRVLAICQKVFQTENQETATALNNLAGIYKSQGKYDKAESLYERALAIRKKVLGSEHADTATLLDNLAGLYIKQGKYNEAAPLYQLALEIHEKELGLEHPHTATSLGNLAGIRKSQGNYDEAESLYRRALIIHQKELGLEHPSTAISLNNLAGLYYCRGNYGKAEELYLEGLAIYEKALETEHPHIATLLCGLAGVYERQGKYKEAEPLNQQALAICEKILGPKHPETATTLIYMAGLYAVQGKHSEAEPLYKRALEICEKTLGADHSRTAIPLNNLAELYRSQGKYDEAKPLYKRSLEINSKVLGSGHPDTAVSLNNLALLCESQGKADKALLLFQRVMVIFEKTLGLEHPDIATVLISQAKIYWNHGNYEEVESLYNRALEIRKKALGSEHPHTVTAMDNLARIYECQGNFNQAELLHRQVLAIQEVLGSEHQDLVMSLNNVALLCERQGKYDEAEILYKRVLDTHEQVLGPKHPETAASLINLAELYRSQDKGKAEMLNQQAQEIYRDAFLSKHPDTAMSLNNLAGFYYRRGNYEKAESLYNKALEICNEVLGSKHPETARSLINLTGLCNSQGRFQEADSWYQELVAIQSSAMNQDNIGAKEAIIEGFSSAKRAREASSDNGLLTVKKAKQNTTEAN